MNHPYQTLQMNDLTFKERYKLMIGSIVPRPIAWVSTMSEAGVPNLAPFSFFNGVCSEPMIISFSPVRRGSDGQKKDTLVNIEATGEFVVNMVTEDNVEAMNTTSGEFLPDENEFEIANLTMLKSQLIKPYRVAESPIQMECVLHQIVHIGDTVGSGDLVLGRVVAMHLSDDVYQNGYILPEKLKPISRLAGSTYAKLGELFDLPRP